MLSGHLSWNFHETSPDDGKTPLSKLPAKFCEQLRVGTTLLEDESHRFGSPSYKILGASLGCIYAVIHSLGITRTEQRLCLKSSNSSQSLNIHSTQLQIDGNSGRAVARVAENLGSNCSPIRAESHGRGAEVKALTREGG